MAEERRVMTTGRRRVVYGLGRRRRRRKRRRRRRDSRAIEVGVETGLVRFWFRLGDHTCPARSVPLSPAIPSRAQRIVSHTPRRPLGRDDSSRRRNVSAVQVSVIRSVCYFFFFFNLFTFHASKRYNRDGVSERTIDCRTHAITYYIR